MRDFQRKRMYSLETGYIYPRYRYAVDYQQAVDLIAQIWRRWGYGRPPILKFRNGRRSNANRSRIHFNVDPHLGGKIGIFTVLHEVSHSLTGLTRCDGHGPKFAAIYLDLIKRFANVDVKAVRAYNRTLPKGNQVKFAPGWNLPRIRRHIKEERLFGRGISDADFETGKSRASGSPIVKGLSFIEKAEKPAPNPYRPLTTMQVIAIQDRIEIMRDTGWDEYGSSGRLVEQAAQGFIGSRGFDRSTPRYAIEALANYLADLDTAHYRSAANRLREWAAFFYGDDGKIIIPKKPKIDRPVKPTIASPKKTDHKMARHERGECVDCGKTDDLTLAGRYQCAGCRIRRAEWRRKRKERLAAQQGPPPMIEVSLDPADGFMIANASDQVAMTAGLLGTQEETAVALMLKMGAIDKGGVFMISHHEAILLDYVIGATNAAIVDLAGSVGRTISNLDPGDTDMMKAMMEIMLRLFRASRRLVSIRNRLVEAHSDAEAIEGLDDALSSPAE